jgi:hypothetical protein
MSKDVMIDLETLGTTADAVILSIGAVKFDLETGIIEDDGFYRSVSVESNLDLGRRISEDTLIWWFKQSPEAQGVYHEEKVALDTALVELSDWIGTDDYKPWANGADFDTPMLQHAYAQLKVETPWKFWNNRCFRTYKNLPGARDVKVLTIRLRWLARSTRSCSRALTRSRSVAAPARPLGGVHEPEH